MRNVVSIGTGTAIDQVTIRQFWPVVPPLSHRLAFERVCLLQLQFFPLLTILCSSVLLLFR